ncbi:ferric-dicitrate binding protein FerR, regulates iron transport through sigma-19 [Chitinophaga eiseniae]|uniref:Ferric-dicitrate binding protein FerR, regulates iron transport through sigma-19 n=1 Tax=Chitinophaga eiseniae TaxID=634771 RepID=A0A1T4MH32_9BACT|nr:FecR domain-containing protein [Chitinophaga eiseniae]SJZ66156.1 ferric-dicitrate binding protein FerR, regulates iron transport through sigma-19 [Chitinophaga eiseniae]
MYPDPAYIKALFKKHANGSITPGETAELIAFLQQGDQEALLPLPDELEDLPAPAMDTAATARVFQQLSVITAPAPSPVRRRTLIRRIAAVSAAAAAVAAAVILLYHPAQPKPLLAAVSTGYGSMKTVTLPDGTVVTLNANSMLQYDSAGWQPGAREVWVNGQAFFDVAPDAAGKFMVHAGDQLTVQVLGTRFHVAARPKGIQVVLNSGKVKINSNAQTLVLQPGEMASYRPGDGELSRQNADTLQLTSWKDNQKVFRDVPLKEIADFIEEQFGAEVTFDAPQLSQLQFTGTTPANDLDVLLNILTKSLDIRIDKHNNQVMIMLAR